MKILWVIHTDTTKEKSAEVIFNKLSKELPLELEFMKFEKYHKDNTQTIYFQSQHTLDNRSDLIFEVLVAAQRVGRGWQLFGDIRSQNDGLSRESSISGIVQMEFHIDP